MKANGAAATQKQKERHFFTNRIGPKVPTNPKGDFGDVTREGERASGNRPRPLEHGGGVILAHVLRSVG
jgi:hypothetical protein